MSQIKNSCQLAFGSRIAGLQPYCPAFVHFEKFGVRGLNSVKTNEYKVLF